MHEQREYFELSEANALIPTLEYYFAELARIQREVNDLTIKAEKLGIRIVQEDNPKPTGNKLRDRFQREIAVLASDYADIIDEIHELGVVVEDPDLGTVNFFSWVDGEEVVLSWQYGEPEINHWFRVTEDFMARRPLKIFPDTQTQHPPLH